MADATLQISNDIIKPIIEAKIQAAILESMDCTKEAISRVVVMVLNSKVDSEGKPDRWSGGKAFLDWLCEKAIKDAARKAVENYVAKCAPEITKAIESEIAKNKSALAKAVVAAVTNAASNSYKIQVSFNSGI